jgi:alkylation response protein AidB-like acyl-CoA dehydrogenase
MDFSLSEEQALIQDTARAFANDELSPIAAELDASGNHALMLPKLNQLAQMGFMGLNIQSKYGGSEVGTVAFSLTITEIARACASTAVTTSVTNLVAEVIQSVGNEAQKQKYLPRICSGEYAAAGFCLSESEAGSDPSSMRTQALKQSNKQTYVLNGNKVFITSGSYAGLFVVWAVTDQDAPRGKGISAFLVEAGTPGLIVGQAESKLGQIGSATNEIHFENCEISADCLLGKENDGFRIAVSELCGGRIGVGSLALGIGLAAMDYARDYIMERKQFGKRLADFQGLQWKMADRYTELECARLLLMQAAYLKDAALPYATAASMAKLTATENANTACYDALQMFGGAGYSKHFPLERMTRDVRVTSLYEGTSEIQRLIIARALLSDAQEK